jgi:uncharacterized protein YjbI with pentapeptide repeats
MRDGENGRKARIAEANFTGARFSDKISFDNVLFEGSTRFANAIFENDVSFYGATFDYYASFHNATFNGWADFEKASFGQAAFKRIEFGSATFDHATFDELVEFVSVHFKDGATFTSIAAKERAVFLDCHFDDICYFQRAKFLDDTDIARATFSDGPDFSEATFGKRANFAYNEYSYDAIFARVKFQGETDFGESNFKRAAWFFESVFSAEARFAPAEFGGEVLCRGARFDGHAQFGGAHVAGRMQLESAGGCGELTLDGLRADGVVEVTGPFTKVSCVGAEIRSRAWFRLADSEFWLDDSAFYAPVTVESQLLPPSPEPEHGAPATRPVRLRSLKGTDAEHLTLIDVDMSRCELTGLRRPELLHLVGRNRFAPMPRGWCLRWRWVPWHWSAREALFEEHIWRRSIGAPARRGGWERPDPGQEIEVSPERLAVTYRQLRAVLEDARNEPGAADFYYGEMEMRRHTPTSPAAERWIIRLYWLISGYGLRALRSLAALAVLGAIVTTALTGFGLAAADLVTASPQHLAGTVTTTPYGQARITATLSGISPQLPPATQRWTAERTRTALEVTLESLAFRSTDQPLTTTGVWITTAARLLGPLLLALALLAVRNRVKR